MSPRVVGWRWNHNYIVPTPFPAYWRYPEGLEVRDRAFRTAFANVRRDVWSEREQRLRAQWEGYG